MEELNERMREIERRSRAAFDASVAAGDAATRARLARARATAIAASRRPWVARPAMWLPLGAAAAVLAALLWRQEEVTVAPAAPVLASEDLDLVAGGEDFDLLGEDADFLAWAAAAADDGVG